MDIEIFGFLGFVFAATTLAAIMNIVSTAQTLRAPPTEVRTTPQDDYGCPRLLIGFAVAPAICRPRLGNRELMGLRGC
jgi:hypothetical protein